MQQKSKFVYDAEDAEGLLLIPSDGFPLPDAPRALAHPGRLAERQMLLEKPHMQPLNALVAELRREERGFVPDFDPLDGGFRARLLFLMEKPGPMTDPLRPGKPGSGFVSRDNDDGTAAAVFDFMQLARIPREETLIWNTIPWWNGTINLTPGEVQEGLARLDRLVDLLPALEGVVLVGRKAGRARPVLEKWGMPVWQSAHPSPRVRSAYPDLYRSIPEVWSEAARAMERLDES